MNKINIISNPTTEDCEKVRRKQEESKLLIYIILYNPEYPIPSWDIVITLRTIDSLIKPFLFYLLKENKIEMNIIDNIHLLFGEINECVF